jgi:hypothetical protein
MRLVLAAIEPHVPPFKIVGEAANCQHNYVARESHFGENVYVTRKGAIRAGESDMGVIPGSMGARSFIVRGKGNPESLCSCAHGAGRLMSRTEARKRFSAADVARPDARGRMPQGCGRGRRDSGSLQAHRRGDGQLVGPGGRRAHAEAGGVRERLANSH